MLLYCLDPAAAWVPTCAREVHAPVRLFNHATDPSCNSLFTSLCAASSAARSSGERFCCCCEAAEGRASPCCDSLGDWMNDATAPQSIAGLWLPGPCCCSGDGGGGDAGCGDGAEVAAAPPVL
jgi:hypothetical protein